MRFYRVNLTNSMDGDRGCEYFTTRREAEKCAREWLRNNRDEDPSAIDATDYDAEITMIDILPTKAGILAALNRYAGHPNNG